MQWKRYCAWLRRIWNLKRNEKTHNRSKPRVWASAGDDCARAQDHEQQLDAPWPTDQDQWRQAASSKPKRIKDQAPSFRPQYNHI